MQIMCWKAGFLSAVHPRRLRTSGMLATGTGFSGSSLDFAPLFARTWSWPGSSSNYSWIGHAHDSGFFLAVTLRMSHWRISHGPSPLTSHGSSHQMHWCARTEHRNPKAKFIWTMGDSIISLGIMPFLWEEKKKGRGKMHKRGPEGTWSMPASSVPCPTCRSSWRGMEDMDRSLFGPMPWPTSQSACHPNSATARLSPLLLHWVNLEAVS